MNKTIAALALTLALSMNTSVYAQPDWVLVHTASGNGIKMEVQRSSLEFLQTRNGTTVVTALIRHGNATVGPQLNRYYVTVSDCKKKTGQIERVNMTHRKKKFTHNFTFGDGFPTSIAAEFICTAANT